jgi:hypothetical protein
MRRPGSKPKHPSSPTCHPRAPGAREHEYTRNGTQCLFAALKVHHGDVIGMASKAVTAET